jgi:glutamyl-tRNA reductase
VLEELGVVGVSWRQEGSEALAGYALPGAGRAERLKRFADRAELDELAYLDTCNRVELVFSPSAGGGARDLRPLAFELLTDRAPRPGEAQRNLKAWRGEGACEHLLMVAAGLDSAALGEPEIVGQVRACRDDAADLGLIGPRLQVLFAEALRIAKRVRDETGLGRGRVSLAEIAVSRVLGALGGKASAVALIGVSAMTRKVGRSLARKNIPLIVVNRTVQRAAELAAELGGRSLALADFLSQPPDLGAIVASTRAGTPLLTEPVLTRIAAVTPPGGAPLLVDMAVPGNIDGQACERLGLRRVGMNEIVEAAQANREARQSEAASARQLVDEALPRVRELFAERVYGPMYGALQEHYREVAIEGINRLLDRKLQGLGSRERQTVSTWAEGLARRLAHIPTQGVRGLLHHGPEGSLDAFLEGLGPDLRRLLRPSRTDRRPAAGVARVRGS